MLSSSGLTNLYRCHYFIQVFQKARPFLLYLIVTEYVCKTAKLFGIEPLIKNWQKFTKFVRPICLPSTLANFANRLAITAGWGEGKWPLKFAFLQIYDEKYCNKTHTPGASIDRISTARGMYYNKVKNKVPISCALNFICWAPKIIKKIIIIKSDFLGSRFLL
jgi:hypothetical protein